MKPLLPMLMPALRMVSIMNIGAEKAKRRRRFFGSDQQRQHIQRFERGAKHQHRALTKSLRQATHASLKKIVPPPHETDQSNSTLNKLRPRCSSMYMPTNGVPIMAAKCQKQVNLMNVR